MASSQRDHRNTALKLPSRPVLTVDTNAPRKKLAEDQALRSAPVGTRQEKGIPPMYQAGDRYCEKRAEMMNSPTWRSQNPGPHLVHPPSKLTVSVASNDHQSLGLITSEEGIRDDQYNDDELHDGNFSTRISSSPSSGTTLMDEVQLSRDGEAVRLIGLHPFLKTPEGAYILSAVASSNADSQDSLHGEMRRVKVFQRRIGTRSEAKESERVFTRAGRDDSVDGHRNSRLAASCPDRSPTDVCTIGRTKSEELGDDARELVKHDEAIPSTDHGLRPGRRQVGATSPDEKQRFGGILQRLRKQCSAQDSSDRPPLEDTAILSTPKMADSTDVTKRREHVRSDSGYASQRRGRGSSEATATEMFKVQHFQGGSYDSGYESPSKNSTLNPAAKEFSAGSKRSSPVKSNAFARPPIDSKLWLPPQQPAGLVVPSPPTLNDPVLNPMPSPWHSPLANASTPLMPFGATQTGLSSHFPGLLPLLGEFAGGVAPTPPGLGIPNPVPPPVAPFTGLSPGHFQPFVRGSIPGLAAPCYHGPFQQQIPSLMTCNNPTHQGLPSFNSPVVTPTLPSAIIPQAPAATLPVHAAAGVQPSPGTLQLPKHVPKPKIPNTTGQQNWELMHELRRTHEPGYAQKCKEKQKKRYLKQLEKNGGSGA